MTCGAAIGTLADRAGLEPALGVLALAFRGVARGGAHRINRVAGWAASIPVASFWVSIDARVAPSYDDTTSLTDAQKAEELRRNAFVGRFRNDLLDEACVAHHQADPRVCFDSGMCCCTTSSGRSSSTRTSRIP